MSAEAKSWREGEGRNASWLQERNMGECCTPIIDRTTAAAVADVASVDEKWDIYLFPDLLDYWVVRCGKLCALWFRI